MPCFHCCSLVVIPLPLSTKLCSHEANINFSSFYLSHADSEAALPFTVVFGSVFISPHALSSWVDYDAHVYGPRLTSNPLTGLITLTSVHIHIVSVPHSWLNPDHVVMEICSF